MDVSRETLQVERPIGSMGRTLFEPDAIDVISDPAHRVVGIEVWPSRNKAKQMVILDLDHQDARALWNALGRALRTVQGAPEE